VFDPYEQALLWAGSDVGIVVPRMNRCTWWRSVTRSSTTRRRPSGRTHSSRRCRFLVRLNRSKPAVNWMATLNLFAAARLSAWTVPLVHGPVLITGVHQDGKPKGLSDAQLKVLGSVAGPNRWATMIPRARERRAECRRRARERA
jgi:hypothetical protein